MPRNSSLVLPSAAGPVNLDLPPWPLFKFGLWLTRSVDAFRDGMVPPYVRAIEIGFSYIKPQARPRKRSGAAPCQQTADTLETCTPLMLRFQL